MLAQVKTIACQEMCLERRLEGKSDKAEYLWRAMTKIRTSFFRRATEKSHAESLVRKDHQDCRFVQEILHGWLGLTAGSAALSTAEMRIGDMTGALLVSSRESQERGCAIHTS